MTDIDHCGCLAELETLEKEVATDATTEVLRCTDCGQTWTWERPPTAVESIELLKRTCRELGHEILTVVGLR